MNLFLEYQQNFDMKIAARRRAVNIISAGYSSMPEFYNWILRHIELTADCAHLAILEYCRGNDAESFSYWCEVVGYGDLFFRGDWTRVTWENMKTDDVAEVVKAFSSWDFGDIANHFIVGSIVANKWYNAGGILSAGLPCGNYNSKFIKPIDIEIFTRFYALHSVDRNPTFQGLIQALDNQIKFKSLRKVLVESKSASALEDELFRLSGRGNSLCVHWIGPMLVQTGMAWPESELLMPRLRTVDALRSARSNIYEP